MLCRAGELGSGLALEAAALAGRQKLDKLVVLAETASDGADALEDEEALRCLPALGWAGRVVDGQDSAAIEAALSWAMRGRKPTLIACRSLGGLPPLPASQNEAFAEAAWDACGHHGAASRRAWLKRQVRHPLRQELERMFAGRLPEGWTKTAATLRSRLADGFGQAGAAHAGHAVLALLSDGLPELACCGATHLPGFGQPASSGSGNGGPGNGGSGNGGSEASGSRAGQSLEGADRVTDRVTLGSAARQVSCGARERGMAFLVAGIALHGGTMPCGLMPLAAADAVRPALRVLARSGRRAVQVLVEDGAVGAVEQLAALRAMTGLRLMRPGDPVELAECFELALRSPGTPTALVLPGRPMPVLRADGAESRAARGGYVFAEAEGERAATLLATGTELRLALRLRLALARLGHPVAVVSLPCWSLFSHQPRRYRDDVLGNAPRFGLEASSGFGWERWLGHDGHFLGAWTPGSDDQPEAVEAIAQQLARRLAPAAAA